MIKKINNDEELVKSYSKNKSIWKTAKEFNVCGQTVHQRLIKLNIKINGNGKKWTKKEELLLIDLYKCGFKRGDGALDKLANDLHRTKFFLCRKAKELCLTNSNRTQNNQMKKNTGIRISQWIKDNGHPKGSLGHKHSNESLKKISIASKKMFLRRTEEEESERIFKQLKTREKNGTLYNKRQKVSWKGGWRTVGGIKKYFRSRWEFNYATYLEFLKQHKQIKKWEHEPKTFWFESIKRGVRSYLLDFRITENNGDINYHEVKGWMDGRSITKIKRMAKYYPNIKLRIIDAKVYKNISKQVSHLISEWEK